MPRGRKKEGRTARLFARVRPEWMVWLRSLSERSGDETPICLIERLVAEEATRIGHTPSPGR